MCSQVHVAKGRRYKNFKKIATTTHIYANPNTQITCTTTNAKAKTLYMYYKLFYLIFSLARIRGRIWMAPVLFKASRREIKL